MVWFPLGRRSSCTSRAGDEATRPCVTIGVMEFKRQHCNLQYRIYEAQLDSALGAEEVITVRFFLNSLQTEARKLHEELMHDLLGGSTDSISSGFCLASRMADYDQLPYADPSKNRASGSNDATKGKSPGCIKPCTCTFMVLLSSAAWMLTSSAEPMAPPAGWCIMIRVLGMAQRLPFVPAACVPARRCSL